MPVYRTSGVLTGTIDPENVAEAQHYLTHMGDEPANMEQYLDPPLHGVVEHLEWTLHGNGHTWHVTAFTSRELTEDELKQLSSEVSGQNSDGLGESFEQQDFAWDDESSDDDCFNCGGRGELEYMEDDEDKTCPECEGEGVLYHDGGRMISFDWEKNDCKFERVK